MSSLPQPGWYPCPENTPNTLRWWNGTTWTTSTREAPTVVPNPEITEDESTDSGRLHKITISPPSRNIPSIITATLAAILILISLPLMFTTMRTEISNCGTIWASEDTWKYSSTYDGPEGYFNSHTAPKNSVSAAVNDMMADMRRGAAAFDDCKNKHHDRMILLFTLGGAAVVLITVSVGLHITQRRSLAPTPFR